MDIINPGLATSLDIVTVAWHRRSDHLLLWVDVVTVAWHTIRLLRLLPRGHFAVTKLYREALKKPALKIIKTR